MDHKLTSEGLQTCSSGGCGPWGRTTGPPARVPAPRLQTAQRTWAWWTCPHRCCPPRTPWREACSWSSFLELPLATDTIGLLCWLMLGMRLICELGNYRINLQLKDFLFVWCWCGVLNLAVFETYYFPTPDIRDICTRKIYLVYLVDILQNVQLL